jgi:hypothetical protein
MKDINYPVGFTIFKLEEDKEEYTVTGYLAKAYRFRDFDSAYDIEEEYMKDEYPVFGGPFTNALTPFQWLKKYYHLPKRK